MIKDLVPRVAYYFEIFIMYCLGSETFVTIQVYLNRAPPRAIKCSRTSPFMIKSRFGMPQSRPLLWKVKQFSMNQLLGQISLKIVMHIYMCVHMTTSRWNSSSLNGPNNNHFFWFIFFVNFKFYHYLSPNVPQLQPSYCLSVCHGRLLWNVGER